MGILDDYDKPNLTEAELFHFLRYEEGLVGVTRRSVRFAIMRRHIVPTKIGNTNYFSKRDGIDWIASSRVPVAVPRTVPANQ